MRIRIFYLYLTISSRAYIFEKNIFLFFLSTCERIKRDLAVLFIHIKIIFHMRQIFLSLTSFFLSFVNVYSLLQYRLKIKNSLVLSFNTCAIHIFFEKE